MPAPEIKGSAEGQSDTPRLHMWTWGSAVAHVLQHTIPISYHCYIVLCKLPTENLLPKIIPHCSATLAAAGLGCAVFVPLSPLNLQILQGTANTIPPITPSSTSCWVRVRGLRPPPPQTRNLRPPPPLPPPCLGLPQGACPPRPQQGGAQTLSPQPGSRGMERGMEWEEGGGW